MNHLKQKAAIFFHFLLVFALNVALMVVSVSSSILQMEDQNLLHQGKEKTFGKIQLICIDFVCCLSANILKMLT